MEIKNDVERYLSHLKSVVRVSPVSLKNYKSTLMAFALKYDELTSENVSDYLSKYSNPASSNVVLVRLKGFAEFMGVALEVRHAKQPVRVTEALNSTELDTLFSYMKKHHKQYYHATVFLARTGLRFGEEFQKLTKESLKEKQDGTKVVKYLAIMGKGRKMRYVPISKSTADIFENDLAFGKIASSGFEKNFRMALTAAGKVLNLPHLHPHLLRASCASIMLNEKNADAIKVC